MKKDIVILILAYNPDEKLIEIVERLKENNIIVIVNDGSENIEDTQTRLRGISVECIREIVNIQGERYEYEINALKYLCSKTEIIEVPIKIVYFRETKSKFRT